MIPNPDTRERLHLLTASVKAERERYVDEQQRSVWSRGFDSGVNACHLPLVAAEHELERERSRKNEQTEADRLRLERRVQKLEGALRELLDASKPHSPRDHEAQARSVRARGAALGVARER
jgi:hypothetical protein